MTAKHLAIGLMHATRARNHEHCRKRLGLSCGTLTRMYKQPGMDIRLSTFDLIQRESGIPADTLLAWYRLPEDAPMDFNPKAT